MAGDHDTVDALAARARAARVAAGEVEARGLRAGRHVVGVGDEVVTLRNDRRLRTDTGEWVRNGDRWVMTARHRDGAVSLASMEGQGSVRLPSAYVAQHLALGYALTIHKAQGSTVEVGIVVVEPTVSSEQLYVGMTRGRQEHRAL